VLIIIRSKLYYTAPGIITPVGGCPVHRLREVSYYDYTEMHVQRNIKSCYFSLRGIRQKKRTRAFYKIVCSLESNPDNMTVAVKNSFTYLLSKENQAGKTNSQFSFSLWCVVSSVYKS
jgi:hypothetical protein